MARCRPMGRNLVLARVGGGSLHAAWLDGSRNWDLRLVPYEALPDRLQRDCTVGDVIPGPKWSGLRELLNGWDGWRAYDYVWMPDDDILADADTISAMFDVAANVGLDLFAPALHEASFYNHFDTMRNQSFHGRFAGFVEIMVPGFSAAALQTLLPTLDLTTTGWGWGLDSLWPKLLGYANVGLIDGTPVVHTRRGGNFRDAELSRVVGEESDRILATHDCQPVHTAFGAFDAALQPLDLSPELLLAQLVKGWQYLIDADPRVLAWITHYQGLHFDFEPYPTSGTPVDVQPR
jgi:hypothetical protein